MKLPDTGVYNAIQLDGAGSYQTYDEGRIPDGKPEQGFTWIDLDYTQPAVQTWLRSESGLKGIIIAALVATDTRPRVVSMDNGLLVILRGINMNPGAAPDDMISIRLWISENMIISTRMRKLFSIDDIRNELERNNGPKTQSEFVIMLSQYLVNRVVDTIDNLEEVMSVIEEKVITTQHIDLRIELSTLRKQIIELRRFLSPQRDVLSQLKHEYADRFNDHDQLQLHEIKEKLVRQIEDLDAIRERATLTSEELISQLSTQMNNRMYILSIIAAVFLPLGFLTGLLGVNIGGIPGAEYQHAFVIFIIIMIIIIIIQISLFKWRRWL